MSIFSFSHLYLYCWCQSNVIIRGGAEGYRFDRGYVYRRGWWSEQQECRLQHVIQCLLCRILYDDCANFVVVLWTLYCNIQQVAWVIVNHYVVRYVHRNIGVGCYSLEVEILCNAAGNMVWGFYSLCDYMMWVSI